jgi:hypothetical protein
LILFSSPSVLPRPPSSLSLSLSISGEYRSLRIERARSATHDHRGIVSLETRDGDPRFPTSFDFGHLVRCCPVSRQDAVARVNCDYISAGARQVAARRDQSSYFSSPATLSQLDTHLFVPLTFPLPLSPREWSRRVEEAGAITSTRRVSDDDSIARLRD